MVGQTYQMPTKFHCRGPGMDWSEKAQNLPQNPQAAHIHILLPPQGKLPWHYQQ